MHFFYNILRGGFIISITFIIVIFIIGFIGSFFSGMLGIGGAIVKYPMLLYIPPLLGFTTFTSHEVAAISAIDVLATSIAGALIYKSSSYLNYKLILIMGTGVLIGSLFGSFISSSLSENTVNIVYGIFASLAAILMFISIKNEKEEKVEEEQDMGQEKDKGQTEQQLEKKVVNGQFNVLLALLLALVIGIGSGIIGAGGGFILVPVMLSILKIPMRVTIASSLAITFILSIGSSTGKIFTNQVEWEFAIILIVASLIAAPLGAKVSQKISIKHLRIILTSLIVMTALKIWIDISIISNFALK